MTVISVYSRSIIGHKFLLVNEIGEEEEFVIEGMNSHGVIMQGIDPVPRLNRMEESIFSKIKDKYKDHVWLFGGKLSSGVVKEPQIYVAKSDKDAQKILADSKPLITENEMGTKAKGIKPLDNKIG